MEENSTPPRERHCPSCGAVVSAEARFCGACGTEALPAADTTAAQPAAAPAPSVVASVAAAPVAAAPVEASGAGQPEASDGRVCLWCGARSPLTATRCSACDATFPTPEGDEALERAARERIQAMESSLKPPRAGWWPFRSR